MRNTSIAVLLGALLLAVVPGSAFTEGEPQLVLKVAVQVPRTQEVAIEAKRYNEKLAAMTNNAVQVRVYWGGSAGDPVDVLRKMRTGQIDGSPLSLELVSRFVRQALVLQSPAMYTNYRQVDAARATLTPAMEKEAYDNGFKVMVWFDIGRLRLLSKRPVASLKDFKSMRPWLYPESEMLKEFYKGIGATGVPLGIGEVYGGLQTGMIDVVWSSALLASALNWHSSTHYISQRGLGFIQLAFAYRRGAWDALPANVQQSMTELSKERAHKAQIEARKDDERTFQRLLQRGHKPVAADSDNAWIEAGRALRKRMIGRVYTQSLVSQAEELVARYPDQPGDNPLAAIGR